MLLVAIGHYCEGNSHEGRRTVGTGEADLEVLLGRSTTAGP